MKRFLKETAGDSIGEVLAAFVIAALGVALFAGMIAVSNNIVNSSQTELHKIYGSSKVLIDSDNEASGTLSFTLESFDGLTVPSHSLGVFPLKVSSTDPASGEHFMSFRLA